MTAGSAERTVKILLIEDAASLGLTYRNYLEEEGYGVTHVMDGASALDALREGGYAVVLLDLQLPDMDGLQILEHIKSKGLESAVIVVTSNASLKMAITAMRSGAYDFIVKPLKKERLITAVHNALQTVVLKQSVRKVDTSRERTCFHRFVGSSLLMQSLYGMIENVAQSAATVFITGESGTGKELCAEAVHLSSARSDRPFVALNCGAIPKDLMESEIFGHMRGSFTGAIADRIGAAKQADGGTLFLDEICELELSLQTKLLRFLQTGTIQRVGSSVAESVDVRILCATNRDPLKEVQGGRFREDLFYRIHVIPLHMPPLRDRQNDAIEIASSFLARFAEEENKPFRTIAANAQEALCAYYWPGNVRELENVIRNIVVMNTGEEITLAMLGDLLNKPVVVANAARGGCAGDATEPGAAATAYPAATAILGKKLWEIEKDAIERTIEACSGSIPKAAGVLGISPSTIYRKKEHWELEGAR